MVVKITKQSKSEDLKKDIAKLKNQKKSKFSIADWSGKIKRGLDGVEYQKEMRIDWQ